METGKTIRAVAKVPDELFVYKEPVLQFNGPVPPTYKVINYGTFSAVTLTLLLIICLAFGWRFCNWPLPIATTRNDGRK